MRPGLSRLAIAILPVVLALLLAAGCGGGVEGGDETGETADASGPVTGKLTISQWPLYIDPGKHNTIAEFEESTGVERQLRRRHQRQPGVLREAAAAVAER